MKHVSVVSVTRRKIATTVLGTLVATAAVQGIANAQTREVSVSTLGGATRFSGPMRGVDDLRAMASANRAQISSVLTQAGLSELTTPMANVLTTGYITETTVAPGTRLEWMALKRGGRASLLHNVRWTGRQSFDAFQFSVESAGYTYTFIVPKVCGNFSLLSRAATPVAIAEPPRAEPPPPPPPPEPAPVAEAPPPPPAPAIVVAEERPYRWMVARSLGSSFGVSSQSNALAVANLQGSETVVTDGGLNYGLQIGYLRRNIGVEFLGDITSNFRMASLALADHPSVNSWMFNILGAIPVSAGRFEPYISGGIGSIVLRTKTFTLDGASVVFTNQGTTAVALNTVNTANAQFGWNLGGGFLGYADRWGIRADIRYYDAADFGTVKLNNGPTLARDYTQALLSGLSYWRANLGLSFRF